MTLKAIIRENLGKKVRKIRDKGQIPAVLYGKNFKNLNLTLEKKDFEKLLSEAGISTLIDLEIPKTDQTKILLREPQRDPVTDKILHVDLYKVDMKQEIHTEIPLKFVGLSAAVEELEGNLIINKDALEIECLPGDLVSEIEVDITLLKTFDDLIKVADLKIPQGINVLAEVDEIIAQVTPPRSEEELKEMDEEATSEAEKTQIENIEAEAEKEKAEKDLEADKEGEESENKTSKKPTASKNE